MRRTRGSTGRAARVSRPQGVQCNYAGRTSLPTAGSGIRGGVTDDGLAGSCAGQARPGSGSIQVNPLPGESRMDFLTWLLVGLVAGVLASFLMGGIGYGIIGDIIVGIVGAFIGGWLFGRMGWTAPFGGIAGVIFVAFIGAVLLLFILGAIRR